MILAGCPSIRLISSGDGMPGVGVRPGLKGFFNWSGLGIPGVGVVPLAGCPRFAGTPGALAGRFTGLADRPGGMFAGSRVDIGWADMFEFPFTEEVEAEFCVTLPLHAIDVHVPINNNETDMALKTVTLRF